jgi:glutaconate CoA-transferase, subunit A
VGRRHVRATLAECVSAFVTPGCELALGGLHFHNTPMAFVREIIRQQIPIGRLVPPVDGSLNADQLIGAGLVDEVHTPYVGLEQFGMAGRFRHAAESGALKIRETEEAGFIFGLMAGAAGLPFAALPGGFMPEGGPVPTVVAVNPGDYQATTDPFTGERIIAVRAIRPDLAMIHCQVIDSRGNCGFLGGPFLDHEIARAARHCIVLAEREVDELPPACRSHLPGLMVDAYCVLEYGAHPGSSHGCYQFDEEHIRNYAAVAKSDHRFALYVLEVIGRSEDSYREVADVVQRCSSLLGTGAPG